MDGTNDDTAFIDAVFAGMVCSVTGKIPSNVTVISEFDELKNLYVSLEAKICVSPDVPTPTSTSTRGLLQLVVLHV